MAWDVDDVLNDLSSAWASHEGLCWGDACGRSPQEMAASLGIDADRYLESLDRFRRDEYRHLVPNPLIQEWLGQTAGLVRSIAITRTPIRAAGRVSRWVFDNYGAWIHGYFVAPSPRPDDPVSMTYETKADVINRLVGVTVLVDDTPANFVGLPATCSAVEYPREWNAGGVPSGALEELRSLVSRAVR